MRTKHTICRGAAECVYKVWEHTAAVHLLRGVVGVVMGSVSVPWQHLSSLILAHPWTLWMHVLAATCCLHDACNPGGVL